MNYNSKRLTNPLKPICKCKTAEFNALVDIIHGSTSTKDHNKKFAFRKTIGELTSPCIDKDNSLTLAEIVMVIPYTATNNVSIYYDVFDVTNTVKPNGFFILVGNNGSVECAESIYYYNDGKTQSYIKNSDNSEDQRIKNLRFPLTDKDITVIKEVLNFNDNALEYNNSTQYGSSLYSGTIYMYRLN